MMLSVRPALPYERVAEIHGYTRVMRNAAHHKLEGFIDIMDERL